MRPCRISVVLLSIAAAGSGVDPALAQDQRMAAFGNVAVVDVAVDDHGYGKMGMYGGELVITLRGTVRAGVDVQVGRISRTDVHYVDIETVPFRRAVTTPFEFRQTAITVSVYREWPSTARVRGMAGGGLGVLFQRLRGVNQPDARYPDLVSWSGSHAPVVLHARGGIIGTVSDHYRIRAEGVFSVSNGIYGILGARVGLGYVF
jgi:hypothetical protein